MPLTAIARGTRERQSWLDKLDAVGINCLADGSGPAKVDFSEFPLFTGLMSVHQAQPKRYRMWLLIWLQVYSLVELYEVILPAVLGGAGWDDLNLHLKFLAGSTKTPKMSRTK